MEHVQQYNEAVTKLKLLLDQSSQFQQLDEQINPPPKDVLLSRQGSLLRNKDQKKWASQEDLLHGSHTKGELRGLVIHQEDYISQLEEELSFCRNQLVSRMNVLSAKGSL